MKSLPHLSAGSNTSETQFNQNILSFAVAYGLCLQGMDKSEIRTNLLPEEIVRTRLVRAKKPWMVAGVAALLMGMTFNYFMHVSAWRDTTTDAMGKAESTAKSVQSFSSGFKSTQSGIHESFDKIQETGVNLVSNVEGRLLWLEMMKAIQAALPKDERPLDKREETVEDISARNELHIIAIDQQFFEDLQGEWFSQIETNYQDARGDGGDTDAEGDDADAEEDEAMADDGEASAEGETATADLSGPGWVVQLTGYHYHNLDKGNQSSRFVNNTLIKNLEEGFVELPDGLKGKNIKVSFADLGLSHPWLVKDSEILDEIVDLEAGLGEKKGGNSGFGGGGFARGAGAAVKTKDGEESTLITLKKYSFIVQFCWKETPKSVRQEKVAARQEEEEAAQADTASLERSGDFR